MMRKKDILLALVAAHEQLLWAKDLLSFEGAAANEGIKQDVAETLNTLESALGTAALDVAVEEAEEYGFFDLCDELRRLTSCDHCPFNDKYGRCWISDVERQDKVSWQQAREKWMDEQGRKRVVVRGEVDENKLPW